MSLSLLLGAALGGAAFFVWSAISWMALGWHVAVYRKFVDEAAVARVIKENCPRSGIYGLPEQINLPANPTAEQRQAAELELSEKMKRGPILTAVVTHEGIGTFPRMLAIALLTAIVVAFGFGMLLAQTHGLSYIQRALFVGAAGLFAGITCKASDWNWHKYPPAHTLVNIADQAIGWTLSGLVLAAFVNP